MLHSNEKQSRSKKTKNDGAIKTVIADFSVWPKFEEWDKYKKKPTRVRKYKPRPTNKPSLSIRLDCSKISFEGQIKRDIKTLKG